jgi:hypothetical protein
MSANKETFKMNVGSDRLSVQIDLSTKTLCDAIGKLEFCSRLLYQLSPNKDGVWTPLRSGHRINAHILGFPPSIRWSRTNEKMVTGSSDSPLTDDELSDLEISLEGLIGTKKSIFSNTEYLFFIKNLDDNKIYDYSFTSRARSLVAFCILWDLEDHPRDHLELTRDPKVPFLEDFPQKIDKSQPIKTYGDPSKTVDELRNQGFPRDSDQSPNGSRLAITRLKKYETYQEHYKLLNREQSLADRVGRSQIPNKFKLRLYEKFEYRCNNCGEQYEDSYLAPDHRVPSIVKADNLTSENYLGVLQALCVRCNQVKREACKKCPYQHRCENCAWAYPETKSISAHSLKILQAQANSEGVSINEWIQKKFGLHKN